ncbi:hypothetical protein [Streptomyces qinzhouensis]|uniref:hypothetical protein n=1 Tax=Streptomyces qinzhouensis TaxID=2599401 RepID=UPI0016463FE3|nr:hypothetical protein [Streptomyces qinzhouensis]
MTTDHDELVADRLRTAADRAAGRVRPVGASVIAGRARARGRRRVLAVTGAGVLGTAATLVALAFTGGGAGTVPAPVTPAGPSGGTTAPAVSRPLLTMPPAATKGPAATAAVRGADARRSPLPADRTSPSASLPPAGTATGR